MRPPFGDTNDHVLEILRELDYRVILWSLNTNDWQYASLDNADELDPYFRRVEQGFADVI